MLIREYIDQYNHNIYAHPYKWNYNDTCEKYFSAEQMVRKKLYSHVFQKGSNRCKGAVTLALNRLLDVSDDSIRACEEVLSKALHLTQLEGKRDELFS